MAHHDFEGTNDQNVIFSNSSVMYLLAMKA